MTSASSPSAVFAIRPSTPAEVDFLATVSAISFIAGVLAFACVIGAAVAVALKTKLPGRRSILLSLVVLAGWWAFEQLMGGNLEMTFGPVALLVSYALYSAIAVIFSLGYLRMCFSIHRERVGQRATR